MVAVQDSTTRREPLEECSHLIWVGRIDQALFEHLVDVRVAGAAEAAYCGVDVVIGSAKRDIRAEERPIAGGDALVWRTDAPGVRRTGDH